MAIIRTLLVEDNPATRRALRALLEERGHVQVLAAVDSEASATLELQSHASLFDLVIVDLYLNSGSGIGVLQWLAAFAKQLTCIVVTNVATPAVRVQCDRLGAKRVFDKSSQIEELIDYCDALSEALPASR